MYTFEIWAMGEIVAIVVAEDFMQVNNLLELHEFYQECNDYHVKRLGMSSKLRPSIRIMAAASE